MVYRTTPFSMTLKDPKPSLLLINLQSYTLNPLLAVARVVLVLSLIIFSNLTLVLIIIDLVLVQLALKVWSLSLAIKKIKKT